jgi:hypothetical protein
MTIYYFILKRFPRKEKRNELRKFFEGDEKGVPENLLANNEYFVDFNLQLPEKLPDNPNPLNKKNYATLDTDIQTTFSLRTIRNIIIKENAVSESNSTAIYEIFNRLNSGGINLRPQEIRASLFHSDFYKMLARINQNEYWRTITPSKSPDLHMKDIEILLRSIALLMERENYKPSMTKFLNKFSNDAKSFDHELISYLESLFEKFVEAYSKISRDVFYTGNNRFSLTIFESIFYFSCTDAYKKRNLSIRITDEEKLNNLRKDEDYNKAILENTASTRSINTRLDRALLILKK